MGYPANFWIFDEEKLLKIIKDFKASKNTDEFLKKYDKEISKILSKYESDAFKDIVREHYPNLLRQEQENENCDYLLMYFVMLSGAKLFELEGFRLFEYVGFIDYTKEKKPGSTEFKAIENLLAPIQKELFGLKLSSREPSGVEGYLSSKDVQTYGQQLLTFLKSIEIREENKILFKYFLLRMRNMTIDEILKKENLTTLTYDTTLKYYQRFKELQNSDSVKQKVYVTQEMIERFESARSKLIEIINCAYQNRQTIIMFGS